MVGENENLMKKYVKKNYFDSTAIFYYSLGASFVHLAMLIVNISLIKRADVARAKFLDDQYTQDLLTYHGATPVSSTFCEHLA